MQTDCMGFVKQINKGNVLTMGEITLTRFYDEFAVNVTGVAVNAVFSETVGMSDCFVAH